MSDSRDVLVVDDDRDLCWVLTHVLGSAGYRVATAFDAAKAQPFLFSGSVDVALIDYRLPGQDGIALLEALPRGARPRVTRLMTSYPTDAILERARRVGFGGTMAKPIDHSRLVAELEQALQSGKEEGDSLPASRPSSSLSLADRLLFEGVLHDLGNPLHSAISTLSYLETKLQEQPGPLLDRLSAVLRSLNRADGMLRGLLALRKNTRVAQEPVSLNAVLEEALELMEAEFRAHRVEIRRSLQKGLPPFLGCPDDVARLCFNLLSNSLGAMPDGGVLEVSTQTIVTDSRQHVELCVLDSGPGFAEEIRECAGQPFLSTKGEGHGLGLFLCRQIVRAHKGSLSLGNRPGGGAVVQVRFPRTTEELV